MKDKTISIAADWLRRAADELDSIQVHLALPVQPGCDILAAFRKLRLVLGNEAYINITPFKQYRGDAPIEVDWEIYDSTVKQTFYGTSLADAVNKCLASHQPEKEGDAKADMAMIQESLAEPLPMQRSIRPEGE